MFRRLTAAALVVLVQAGAIAAPLTHVHLDADETAHHHGQALHAHLWGHDASPPVPHHGPVADHQESAGRTLVTHMFVAPAAEPFSLPAIASQSFALVVPPAQPRGGTPHVAHGHDPPALAVRSPRAPPASLS